MWYNIVTKLRGIEIGIILISMYINGYKHEVQSYTINKCCSSRIASSVKHEKRICTFLVRCELSCNIEFTGLYMLKLPILGKLQRLIGEAGNTVLSSFDSCRLELKDNVS